VLYAPEADKPIASEGLQAYSNFVSPRSYLIYLGTVLGQPWLGYSKYWHLFTIDRFLPGSGFKIDPAFDQEPLTVCSSGYLRRVESGSKKYDASLDQLDNFESTSA